MSHILEIKNLHARIDANLSGAGSKEILKGVDLVVNSGETHAIMGPNGSGKSTLALVLMGHPHYEVTHGSVTLDGADVLAMTPDERSRAGLFLSFQDPPEVPGVSFFQYLRAATGKHRSLVTGSDRHPGGSETTDRISRDSIRSYNSAELSASLQNDKTTNHKPQTANIPVAEFRKEMQARMDELHMGDDFMQRHLNTGFSGGEKKRAEMLQMSILKPTMAILDEVDSGLDIDALKLVAATVKSMATDERGILMITHYQRILNYVEPDFVHIFRDGRIVKTGGYELAERLEAEGYDKLTDEAKAEALEEVIDR